MTEKLPLLPFIVGVPRSGTTLLRLMLDSHPDLTIPPETHFMRGLFKIEDRGRLTPERFVNFITGHRRWPDFGLDSDAFKGAVERLDEFNMRNGLIVFYRLYAEKMGKPRWGDKTLGYVVLMSRISEVFPEAHFIHMIRDGRDTVLSRKGCWLGREQTVEQLAMDWRDLILTARAETKRLKYYMELRYEDLVMNPEAVLIRVVDYLGLPYSDEMLNYYKRAEERLNELKDFPANKNNTALSRKNRLKIHEKTLMPPDRNNLFRWKREMTEEDKNKFMKIAGDLLEELGYEID
jgi:hypothetical protein